MDTTSRRLVLRREALTELSPGDLHRVVGAGEVRAGFTDTGPTCFNDPVAAITTLLEQGIG
jgi:hypothetical protein